MSMSLFLPRKQVYLYHFLGGFPGGSVVKNPPASAGNTGRPLDQETQVDPPGGGDGHPLQYSCLENPVDRGA